MDCLPGRTAGPSTAFAGYASSLAQDDNS